METTEKVYDWNNPIPPDEIEILINYEEGKESHVLFKWDNRFFRQVYIRGGYFGFLHIYEYPTTQDLENETNGVMIYGAHKNQTTPEGNFIEYSLRKKVAFTKV